MRRLIGVALLLAGGCAPSSTQQNTLDEMETNLLSIDPIVAATDNLQASDASGESTWTYSDDVDPMSDEKTELACVRSSNAIFLSSPYGETHGRLCLRNSPQFGRDAYVSLTQDGQMLCRSYESCDIRIRFDKEPAETWSAIGPSDHSSDMLFIEDRSSFERKVRKADKVHIQIEYYQNGMQTFTFNTAGFDWPTSASNSRDAQGEAKSDDEATDGL